MSRSSLFPPKLQKYRPPAAPGKVGIVWTLRRKFGLRNGMTIEKRVKRLRQWLTDLGYQCPKCSRLLASGARCPMHPRLRLPSNSGIAGLNRLS